MSTKQNNTVRNRVVANAGTSTNNAKGKPFVPKSAPKEVLIARKRERMEPVLIEPSTWDKTRLVIDPACRDGDSTSSFVWYMNPDGRKCVPMLQLPPREASIVYQYAYNKPKTYENISGANLA